VLLFIFSAGFAFGHDPIASWATAQLYSDRLELTLTLATETAWLVMGGTLDTAPNVEGSLPQLQVKAAEAYQLSVGGRILAPREISAALHEEDAVKIRFIFDRPDAGPVHFDALYLLRLAPNHRSTLTLVDAANNLIRGELLSASKHAVDIELPAAEAAKPAIATSAATSAPAQPTVSFLAFLKLGIEHILTGYDHLLFLLGLLVVCRRVSSMMAIITCFTLAHSLTLALAALNVVSIPSRVVEPLIAASIIFIGIENLVRHGEPKGRWLLTFAFGLIHGFGFASVLRAIGLGAGGASLFVPLFSFNLGVEIGQLSVVAVGLPLLWLLRTRPVFARYGEAAISLVVLLLGSYWLWQRTIA
jgi:hydrogenase/urease accessory protein HupE